MIRLAARPCPPELTPEVQAALTAKYLADKTTAPWEKAYIEQELLLMSHDKCCYCECHIREESKYMEVEHFFAKRWHETQVLEWTNLLPACKRCNVRKSDHDCAIEPIIHPVQNDPRDHLKWRAYRFYDKTQLGKRTIDVVDLNDLERLVKKRFEIGGEIYRQLDLLEDIVIDFQKGANTSIQRKNKIINWIKTILKEAQPQKEYAATAATVLLNEPLYQNVKSILQACQIWGTEMDDLEISARAIALDLF
ncbi:MAG: HNH endonuclease [Saprospiraceae bacterium]|nr:HNH endonuclease [Saprospiraceae bacterium]